MYIKEIASTVGKKSLAILALLSMIVEIVSIIVVFIIALPWIFIRGQASLEAEIMRDMIKDHWTEGIVFGKELWKGE